MKGIIKTIKNIVVSIMLPDDEMAKKYAEKYGNTF